MSQQTYPATNPHMAGRRNPVVPGVHPAFESVSAAVPAEGTSPRSTVAHTAPTEHATRP